jgi:UDPglucose 6-dehydrogenase
MQETKKLYGNRIVYATDQYEALNGVHAVALMTEWPEFRILDFTRMAELMEEKAIFDGRNIYDPSEIKKAGFVYYGIGRR